MKLCGLSCKVHLHTCPCHCLQTTLVLNTTVVTAEETSSDGWSSLELCWKPCGSALWNRKADVKMAVQPPIAAVPLRCQHLAACLLPPPCTPPPPPIWRPKCCPGIRESGSSIMPETCPDKQTNSSSPPPPSLPVRWHKTCPEIWESGSSFIQ